MAKNNKDICFWSRLFVSRKQQSTFSSAPPCSSNPVLPPLGNWLPVAVYNTTLTLVHEANTPPRLRGRA